MIWVTKTSFLCTQRSVLTNDHHKASSAFLMLLFSSGGSTIKIETDEKITSKIEINATAITVPFVLLRKIKDTRDFVERNALRILSRRMTRNNSP
jgi:hypothetical protein